MPDRPSGTDTQPSDADLVVRAQTGDHAAFEALVRRYQGIAVAKAYAVLRSRQDAEDAAQDAFLRAYRALSQLRTPGAFGSWLLRTVTNVALRAATKRAKRPIALADPEAIHTPLPELEVNDAIAQLPEGQQQVIHLFYGQGHSCAEIASLLGLQVSSITARLSRARRTLRDLLGEESDRR